MLLLESHQDLRLFQLVAGDDGSPLIRDTELPTGRELRCNKERITSRCELEVGAHLRGC